MEESPVILFHLSGETVRGSLRVEGITEGMVAMDVAEALRSYWPNTIVTAEIPEQHPPDCGCGLELWPEVVTIFALIHTMIMIDERRRDRCESYPMHVAQIMKLSMGTEIKRMVMALGRVVEARGISMRIRDTASTVLDTISGTIPMVAGLTAAHDMAREYFRDEDRRINMGTCGRCSGPLTSEGACTNPVCPTDAPRVN